MLRNPNGFRDKNTVIHLVKFRRFALAKMCSHLLFNAVLFSPLIFQILRDRTTLLAESPLSRAENTGCIKKLVRFHVGNVADLLNKRYPLVSYQLLVASDLFTRMGKSALVPFRYLLLISGETDSFFEQQLNDLRPPRSTGSAAP